MEALANPDCGWFYRRGVDTFSIIPGSPIAYWASDGIRNAFLNGTPLREYVEMPYGFKTGDNNRFLRYWWECDLKKTCLIAGSEEEAVASHEKWFPYNKGGAFRKWYGNNDHLLDYKNGGNEVIGQAKQEGRNAADYKHSLFFKPVITWSRISSGRLHMRYSARGSICDMTGCGFYGPAKVLSYLQAFCNSSVALNIAGILSPTLDFQPGQIGCYPVLGADANQDVIVIVDALRNLSKEDWDSFEYSWDFRRHPLVNHE